MTMTPEQIAKEIRYLASTYWGQGRQDFYDLADRIYPTAPCTIDQGEGYEVEWFTRGAVCVSPKGIVWYSWNRGGVPVVPKSEVRPVMHPWPERPADKEPQ